MLLLYLLSLQFAQEYIKLLASRDIFEKGITDFLAIVPAEHVQVIQLVTLEKYLCFIIHPSFVNFVRVMNILIEPVEFEEVVEVHESYLEKPNLNAWNEQEGKF